MILNFARLLTVTFGIVALLPVSVALADDWPFPRADQTSSGATATQLAEKLEGLWEFKADAGVEATAAIVGDKIYIADVAGTLYCLDAASGQEHWRLATEIGFTTGPSVQKGLLVIGDLDGKVYAVDAASGKLRWTAETQAEVSGAAAFYKDMVLITSQDGNLYALAASDGKVVWTYETSDQIRCSPTVIGDRTFLGGCDGKLHSINLADGKAAAEPLPLGGPTGSTPAILGDFAYLPIMDGAVIAFNWKTNREQWRHEDQERAQEYRSSAAVKDNMVIVSSQNKQVDALDAKSGKPIWQQTLRRRADASPVIAGDDCWIAATDGRLIRLALKDGSEKWTFETNGQFIASPAVANNCLYIADNKGVVRCFGAAK